MIPKAMTKADVLRAIKSGGLPVVISGAGIVGKVLLSVCRKEGIKVECFCDNSAKVAGTVFCGLEVIHTTDMKKRYSDATVLISVAAIRDVVDLLTNMGFENWHAGGVLLQDMDIAQASSTAAIDYEKYALETCIICHTGYLHPDKLFLRSIDLIITERCSLRCKDCANLMQYYDRPSDCDPAMLLRSIDVFCAIVDEVMDFRVIGGDAFMSRDWPTIVRRLTGEPKARRVVLYTNGTIVPKNREVECLRNSKVVVIATDYGKLSRKIDALKQLLQANGIAFHALKVDSWLDCAAIVPHNRGAQGNADIFRLCCAKNMATLSNGRLFRCPYSANAARLRAVPDFKSDYVDLFQESISDAVALRRARQKVLGFMSGTNRLETCDYCNGRPLSGVEVRPAVQTTKPLRYHMYV